MQWTRRRRTCGRDRSLGCSAMIADRVAAAMWPASSAGATASVAAAQLGRQLGRVAAARVREPRQLPLHVGGEK